MIKAILFDYGGVLGNDSDAWKNEFTKIVSVTGLSPAKLSAVFEKHWPLLKIGKAPVLSFWKDVSCLAPGKTSPAVLDSTYIHHISINSEVLNLAKSMKNDYIVGILSNETKEWMNAKIKKYNLRETFDPIYCSGVLGIAKPDRKLFLHVLSDLNLNPEVIVFIDNQQHNLNAANKLKFHTILYQNPTQLKSELISLLNR